MDWRATAQRLGAVAAVAAVALAGSVTFVRVAARGGISTEETVPDTPVALVLGALVYPDGTPSPFLTRRLEVARRLYDAGRVQTIIVSGDGMAPEYDEPLAMRRYLLRAGVPPERVVVDGGGFDTYHSCVRARQVFGVSEVVLVSQDYHLPRAVATARCVGLSAVGVGDRASRRSSRPYLTGVSRDQLACVKTVLDLVVRHRARV